MARRLTALLVLWVGLLGAGSPALACAADALDGDCCPQEAPLPCGDDTAEYHSSTTGVMCCAPANVGARAASIDSRRASQDREHDSGTPDPLIRPAPFDSPTGAPCARHLTAPADSPARTDAALTYLRTGRLRL